MANKQEQARQLYQQCQEAYTEFLTIPHTQSILSTDGEDIDMPSNFYDAYNVPAELLYQKLYGNNPDDDIRMTFDHKLLFMMHKKVAFDKNSFEQNLKQKDKRNQKCYTVYFEAYYHQTSSSAPLFRRQISIDGAVFKWCNKQAFRRQVCIMENREDAYKGLYKERCNERFSLRRNESINTFNLRPIKASVRAFDEIEAANIVASRFNDFMTCANVVQSFGSLSFTTSSNTTTTTHKTAIVSIGVLLVRSPDNSVDILLDNSRQALPKESLTITDKPARMKRLKTLLNAFADSSVAAKRLKSVTQELSQAIETDNPNLRQLSYWRCLEIISAKSDSENRKESDIIKIFQNYHPKTKHWHQMGELIKNLRNRYVHQGIGREGHKLNEYHLNWSQKYAEAAFGIALYLYEHRNTWKTAADIDTFFDCYPKSNRELVLANRFLIARDTSRRKAA